MAWAFIPDGAARVHKASERRDKLPGGQNPQTETEPAQAIFDGAFIPAWYAASTVETTAPLEFDEELVHGLDIWATPEESTDELVAGDRQACDAAARTIDELDLETPGKHHPDGTVSLR
ncbi:MAG TPA: hypothetical protein VFI00_02640 [Kribbella sp.]|nr:hypothetical protein [Kribbella sp.]